MKRTAELKVWTNAGSNRFRRAEHAFSLVEMLVVLAIIASVASVVTVAVLRTLDGEEEKQCLSNMVLIEAAKDEYARDHVGTTSVDAAELSRYFRFGVPHCPRDPNGAYVNWSNLDAVVTCPLHPDNAAKLNQR